MKLKFLLEVEIDDGFVNDRDNPDFWAELLQERMTKLFAASKEDTALKTFEVTTTPSTGKVWASLTDDQQGALIVCLINDIANGIYDFAADILQNLPDEEIEEMVNQQKNP